MNEELLTQHTFNSIELISVSPEVKSATQQAISMVWGKFHSEPETFNIVYAKYLRNAQTKENEDIIAQYDPDKDTFKIALGPMKTLFNVPLLDEMKAFILAAHETVHKVQFARPGDKPKPSSQQTDLEYYDNTHENEAWIEALDAFKKFSPNSIGNLKIGHRRYTIPEISTY